MAAPFVALERRPNQNRNAPMIDLRVGPAQPQAPLSGAFHTWTGTDGAAWLQFFRQRDGYLLRFPDLADFRVENGGLNVTCVPAPETLEATSQHLYLNQVLPLVLSSLGELVFHASAVEIENRAVAFVAESGRGKSTLAAAFATAGFRFLADDGLVVRGHHDGFEVLPSHPSIRLWEDSEKALIAENAIKGFAVSYTSKVRFLAGSGLPFCDSPRALARIYLLDDGGAPKPTIEQLAAPEAMVALVKHSFLLDIEEKQRLATHFEQVTRLVRLPILYRLDYPRRYEQLESLRHTILDHALA